MNRSNYYWRFFKKSFGGLKKSPHGFSIVVATYNRSRFLQTCIQSILAAAELPFELIIWDNNSTDDTHSVVQEFIAAQAPVTYLRCERNIGTNGYARAFLTARFNYLVEADDDVLAVPKGWDRQMANAFKTIPRLGYCALDVVQDRFTNGAKPEAHFYRENTYGGIALLEGPTGGWFTGTTRRIYNMVGGFVYRPSKPFHLEDGMYCRKMQLTGYRYGILRGMYAYHACGEKWNAAFGYNKVWKEKYSVDHPSFVDRIDTVSPEDLPDMSVPGKALQDVLRA